MSEPIFAEEAIVRATLKLVEGAAAGAAAAYLFDPDRGRARRARLRDQVAARLRRRTRWASHRVRDVENRTRGLAARATGHGRFHPTDDRDVAEHRRMVLAGLDIPTGDVAVEVVDGVVRLRGEVRIHAFMDRIVGAVSQVPGVQRVENLMHVPGQPPPNKADALRASRPTT
jgi:hypothetical protein